MTEAITPSLRAFMCGILHEMSLKETKHHLQADVYNDGVNLRFIDSGVRAKWNGEYLTSVTKETPDGLMAECVKFAAAECEAEHAKGGHDFATFVRGKEHFWKE